MGILSNLFGAKTEPTYALDTDFDFQDASTRAYLKRVALDAGVNFIARRFAQAKFKHVVDGKFVKDDAWYRLNTRPNRNETATQFWEHVIHKLIYEGECLVIVNDTKELLVADSYVHTKYANYDDIFEGVYVRGYRYERTFTMSEVIYLTYQNERLERYTNSLFADYGTMLGRMVAIQLRNNQIRGVLKVNTTYGAQREKQEQLQGYLDKVFNSFSNNTVALVPLTDGFDYQEIGGTKSNTQQQFDQIKQLRKDAIATVADILGIPENMLFETPAEVNQLEKSFNQGVLQFFYQLVIDELNGKLVSNYSSEEYRIVGKNERDIFSLSESIDKLVSSGAFRRNEIREALGWERVDDPALDEFYITKNYTTTKGGDEE
ncbi:phage portal protein [Ligilactobacillus saerimneri]|uniref:Phage portal protein n=1 Tax=Ligilactobacillus saerimneri TaxID=228229 RepID=A0A7H9EJM1_9LACO|nr:phage portal protein [Ligilactobacillus saerimneri]QLL77649.1 phage portal protein [Ligilactobacillus saerimneri]